MQEDLAWIDAFRRHHIYPSQVEDLSEDSLLWRNPQKRTNRTTFDFAQCAEL
jgi:hypothetical protein